MIINRIGAASEVPPPINYHPSGRMAPRNIDKSITRAESSQPKYESSETNLRLLLQGITIRWEEPYLKILPKA